MEKETKKMPYHLTVTNNETGETIRDLDFDALVGAVHLSEGESGGLLVTRCSTLALAETISAAELAVEKTLKGNPFLCMAKGMLDAAEVKEDQEPENNQ